MSKTQIIFWGENPERSNLLPGALEKNPFAAAPPLYIRVYIRAVYPSDKVYLPFYRWDDFTDGTIRKKTGSEWNREWVGLYSPTSSLRPQ